LDKESIFATFFWNKNGQIIKKLFFHLPNTKSIISGGPMVSSAVAGQMCIIDGCRNGNGFLATSIKFAQIIGANLQIIRREIVLIN